MHPLVAITHRYFNCYNERSDVRFDFGLAADIFPSPKNGRAPVIEHRQSFLFLHNATASSIGTSRMHVLDFSSAATESLASDQ